MCIESWIELMFAAGPERESDYAGDVLMRRFEDRDKDGLRVPAPPNTHHVLMGNLFETHKQFLC